MMRTGLVIISTSLIFVFIVLGSTQACFSWEVSCDDRTNNVDRDAYTIYTIKVEMRPGCRSKYWLYFHSDGEPPGWKTKVLNQEGRVIPKGSGFVLTGTVTYYFSMVVFCPDDAGSGESAPITLHITADDRYNQNETKDVETDTTCNGIVHRAPDDVHLEVDQTTESSVTLSWDQCTSTDFSRYEIHMSSYDKFIPVRNTAVHNITSRSTTTYTVNDLSPGTNYTFRVRVWDNEPQPNGPYFSDSNIVVARTEGINYPPEAINITSIWDTGNNYTRISWTRCDDDDFNRYEIHASTEENFTITDSTLLRTIYDQDATSVLLHGLIENATNYIRIRVFDLGGLYNESNEVKVTTEDWVPPSIRILNITDVRSDSLHIRWENAEITDFDRYEVYASTVSGFVPNASTLRTTVDDQCYNETDITSLQYYTEYFFVVRVVDKGGNYADSDEVNVTTAPDGESPDAVVIGQPVEEDSTSDSIYLHWSRSTCNDFERYLLYISNTPDFEIPDECLLAANITEREENHTWVCDLEYYTVYYFKVRVLDVESLYSDSNEIRVRTKPDGLRPESVDVQELDDQDVTDASVDLRWTECTSNDFLSYEVFYSMSPHFDPDDAVLSANITDRHQTAITVDGLEPETTYYFKVRVWDVEGLSSLSNEVSATTKEKPPDGEPPTSVVLKDVSADDVTHHTVRLEWTKCTCSDFDRYEVYVSTVKAFDIDTQGELRKTLTDRTKTTCTIGDLEAETTYYFRVRVWDVEELCSDSNEVNATTKELPPEERPPDPVTLYTPFDVSPDSISLRWSRSDAPDFDRYEVHMSTSTFEPDANTLMYTIFDQDDCAVTMTDLEEVTTYWFIVRVVDKQGYTSDSNPLTATTQNAPPAPVEVDHPHSITSTSMIVIWSESEDKDFDRYEVHVSTVSGFTPSSSTMIAQITDPHDTTWQISGLSPSTTYFVIVVVYDEHGSYTASAEVSGTTQEFGDEDGGGGEGMPGFEMIILLISLSAALLLVRHRI